MNLVVQVGKLGVVCLCCLGCGFENHSSKTPARSIDAVSNEARLPASRLEGEKSNFTKEELETLVLDAIETGKPIMLVTVSGHERMRPTLGADGARCAVLAAQKLTAGEDFLHVGMKIHLYPFTDNGNVILLNIPGANWLEFEHLESIQHIISLAKKREAAQ